MLFASLNKIMQFTLKEQAKIGHYPYSHHLMLNGLRLNHQH